VIKRKEYLDKLISWREKQVIKVVTGVRRCGKSTLFKLYIEYLKNEGISEEQIISINLEDLAFDNLLEYHDLYNYVSDRLCEGKCTYVFIDEVQECHKFEKVVDSLFIKENVDVYITGSNAHMLSGELATLLSGRYIEIGMLPLSFKEYCDFAEGENVQEKFNNYLKGGSFPYVAMLENDSNAIRNYIEGIYNTILIKDIARREGIGDIAVLESIVRFLASSIGSPISAKKISDTINSSGRRISVNTVDSYLRALTESFIFYKVNRYDVKGRQFLKTLGKYYIVDTGIRELLINISGLDIGHILENVVYLELIRRGYKVSVGKLAEKEIDFVAKNSDGTEYYQISASVLDEKTLERELAPLQKIQDNYAKYLLTLDEIIPKADYDGIRQRSIIDWLLGLD